MTRDEMHARFQRVVERGLERAERQEREDRARIRRLPTLAIDYNPGSLKGTARPLATEPRSDGAPAGALAVSAVLGYDPDAGRRRRPVLALEEDEGA